MPMFSRIKAAQKYELYDASQGVSSLSRVTVEDVRNIWIHRLISEVSVFIIIHPYHNFDYIIRSSSPPTRWTSPERS